MWDCFPSNIMFKNPNHGTKKFNTELDIRGWDKNLYPVLQLALSNEVSLKVSRHIGF